VVTSWNASIGRDAEIRLDVLGTTGGASIHNVDGSFYDLRLCQHDKNHSTVLVDPPDAWGGRALQEWSRQLASGAGFDPRASEFLASSRLLDKIYAWRP
jgi:hypothetical protein